MTTLENFATAGSCNLERDEILLFGSVDLPFPHRLSSRLWSIVIAIRNDLDLHLISRVMGPQSKSRMRQRKSQKPQIVIGFKAYQTSSLNGRQKHPWCMFSAVFAMIFAEDCRRLLQGQECGQSKPCEHLSNLTRMSEYDIISEVITNMFPS